MKGNKREASEAEGEKTHGMGNMEAKKKALFGGWCGWWVDWVNVCVTVCRWLLVFGLVFFSRMSFLQYS